MSNLNAIKNRISVVISTKKITHAMELVATSKLRRYKQNYLNVQAYQSLLEDTFNQLISRLSPLELKNILPTTTTNSDLYIIITSDLGLCGSYNNNVITLAKQNLKAEDKIFVLGIKGVAALHSSNFKDQIVKEIINYGEEINYDVASILSNLAIEMISKNQVRSVKIIYTDFVNNVVQNAVIKQLLPIKSSNTQTNSLSKNDEAVLQIEPDPQSVLRKSIPLYLASMIYALGTSSKVSEMASRRNSMESATDNANELLKELNLDFNTTRQGIITQEITEIISGADAT